MQTTLAAGSSVSNMGLRGTGQPSTSSRRTSVAVRAKETMCRDVVSAPKAPFQSKGVTYQVTFQGVGDEKKVVECPDDMYILDAAEAAGLDLPATCRGGICGACVGRVAAGGVDMSDIDDLSFTLSDDEVEQGMALLCMARATGNTTIETQCDWGYSLGVCEWKGATGRFSAAPDPLMGSSWSEAKQ